EWDFGDGGSSSLTNPGHNFENMTLSNVDYSVRLVSSTPNLCRDTSYQTIRVHPYIHAEYSLDEFRGCAPFEVELQNASEGAISTYNWDWGDGSLPSLSSDSIILHTYNNTGLAETKHNLVLVVSNIDGCTDTMQRQVTVLPEVQSQFTQDVTEGCNELTVIFTNQSSPSATSFLWEFGDGSSSHEANPIHTFFNKGLNDTIYTVKLIATTAGNCADTSEVDITVYSFIHSEFTFQQETVCSPFDITFNNASVGGSTFEWDFGDGNSTTLYDKSPVVHRFTNPSNASPVTYDITLTVYNSRGCSSVFTRQITVMPSVEANFAVSIDQGCHPLQVNFINNSTGAVSYVWNFDNGESSGDLNPSMVFENYGSNDTVFNVRLIATNSYTCRDSFSVPVTVHPYVYADFAIDYERKCAPADVNFINSSVNGWQYDWTFNGIPYTTTSTEPVNRQFDNPSTSTTAYYRVDLQVTSPQGCISQISNQVSVYHQVIADFTNITEGCSPLEVVFNNTTLGASSYKWEFGDNTSSILENPIHVFPNFGKADTVLYVKLTAISENFCEDSIFSPVLVYPEPKARFIVDKTEGCSPLEVTISNLSDPGNNYEWSFGDGTAPQNVGDTRTIKHTYVNDEGFPQIYTLNLEVTTPNGCRDTLKQKLTIFPRVMVDFERDSAGCSPHITEFTNTSVNASSYSWNFGNGNFSYLDNPGQVFVNSGAETKIFNVELMGYSEYGCGDTITRQVFVYSTPVTEFSFSPVYQYFPSATVQLNNLTNEGSYDFEWDFDDGTSSAVKDPVSYTFSHWGEYDIKLKAFNEYCADSVEHWLKIFPPMPVADFTPDIDSGCVPLTVSMFNNSIYGESYLWEFDDGATSSEFEPSHTFGESGIYQVKLTVIGEGGVDYVFYEIEVFPLPEPNFQIAPALVMLNEDIVKVFNSTKYATSYLWDFGDGSSYTDHETTHVYTELGIYDISLTAWSEHGCEASLLKPEAVEVIGKGYMRYPNAFHPNTSGPTGGYYSMGDRTNTIFYPVSDGVVKYHLMIYSRWGELLFETTELYQGWDGYYKGNLCPQGVYVFSAKVSYSNGKEEEIIGDVTLLHAP
ncbi:MAG: PKD domain-containing protein, partial [Bacteroidales bacterium]|nr:PKD domain-containing protein [Bacteroidales bacterium]